MPAQLHLALHLSEEEIGERYRSATRPVVENATGR